MTHTVSWYSDFDITDPQIGCQQLAGVLKHWETDIAYVQQLSSLTQLTHLSCTARSELGSLEELQQLSLLQTLRLSRLSAQLTLLQIQCKEQVEEIILPFGNGVQLQSLDICGPGHEHTFCLRNLPWARCLKEMSFGIESSQKFEHADLSALFCLTHLQVPKPSRALLQTLSLCSSLKSLYVSCHKQTTLPSTFSLLTQLKRLSIDLLSFAHFPECLLHLSQLETLYMSCSGPDFHLSNSILCLATWPNLKLLNISAQCGTVYQHFSVESGLLLCELRKQLRYCNSSCKF